MKILNCLADLKFDVVSMLENYLILGLVSRANRDLDIFSWDEKKGKWIFPGFQENFGWRVRQVIQRLQDKGIHAEQKKYSELNIKELAVKAGIGKRGKNSLVIHPRFGPWLRFVVIEVGLVVFAHAGKIEPESLRKHPGCEDCNKCLKSCPVNGLLKPYGLKSAEKCLAYVQLEMSPISPTPAPIGRCDKCLTSCMPQPRE